MIAKTITTLIQYWFFFFKKVDQQQETVKSQLSVTGDKVDLRVCCIFADKTDDLSNIEFAKNINKDKYHANHRKGFEREAKS